MESESRRWGKWEIGAAVVLGALLLIALVAAWVANMGSAPAVAAEKPVMVAIFPDGGELRIYQVSSGDLAVDYPQERSWQIMTRNESETYSYGDVHVETDRKNGLVARRVARMDGTDALFLEFSLNGPNGVPQRLPAYLGLWRFVNFESRLGAKSTGGRTFEPAGDSTADLVAAMTATGLPLLIQHRDPESGWIDLNGPYLFDTDSLIRSVSALSAWRRDLEKLEFRAIRSDGAVAEFSLPNPDFRKSPMKGLPKPLPQVHRAADYTLEIRGVKRLASRGRHPFAAVEMLFEADGKPVKGDPGDSVVVNGMTAEDEWGNRVPFEWRSASKGKGAYLPAASRRMTLHLPVRRTENHPRDETDGFMLLEGVVAADGVNVDFEPGPAAARFGIEKAISGTIRPSKAPFEVKDWKVLDVAVSITGSEAELKTWESRLGKMSEWELHTFPEASRESTGIVTNRLFNSSTGTFGFKFTVPYLWQAPPEMLKAGAKLRIGIFGPLPGDDLTFEVELPAKISGE